MALYGPVALPTQLAAGATLTTVICTIEAQDGSGVGAGRVELTPPAGFATVTGVATNNATFNFRQLRNGAPLATFASITLNAGTNLVAETALLVPITAVVSMQQNDVIDVQQVQNGTGLAVGAGVLVETVIN